MFRILFFMMFVFVALPVEAKVCFLPDVMGSNPNCLGEPIECQYTRTSPCVIWAESSCTRDGRTYYSCHCTSTRTTDISYNGNTKYHCKVNYESYQHGDTSCGCPLSDVKCNSTKYPTKETACTGGSELDLSDYCEDPNETIVTESGPRMVRWGKCICSSTAYPEDCTQGGLKKPTDDTARCRDSDGKDHYAYCLCADNWGTTPCNENTNGCTKYLGSVERVGMDTCYHCGPETCDDPNQINIDALWCSYTNTDCRALGYSQSTPETCSDGSKAIVCPFDKSYRYCSVL